MIASGLWVCTLNCDKQQLRFVQLTAMKNKHFDTSTVVMAHGSREHCVVVNEGLKQRFKRTFEPEF